MAPLLSDYLALLMLLCLCKPVVAQVNAGGFLMVSR